MLLNIHFTKRYDISRDSVKASSCFSGCKAYRGLKERKPQSLSIHCCVCDWEALLCLKCMWRAEMLVHKRVSEDSCSDRDVNVVIPCWDLLSISSTEKHIKINHGSSRQGATLGIQHFRVFRGLRLQCHSRSISCHLNGCDGRVQEPFLFAVLQHRLD